MIFSSRRFLQKTNKRILLYYYETSGRLVFVCFLEEIEDTKKTFRNYLTFSQITQSYNFEPLILILWERNDEIPLGSKTCFLKRPKITTGPTKNLDILTPLYSVSQIHIWNDRESFKRKAIHSHSHLSKRKELDTYVRYYGNIGCRVFKRARGTKLERFLPKN